MGKKRNHIIQADIVDLTPGEAKNLQVEIMKAKNKVAPKAHGRITDGTDVGMLGGLRKIMKELGDGK